MSKRHIVVLFGFTTLKKSQQRLTSSSSLLYSISFGLLFILSPPLFLTTLLHFLKILHHKDHFGCVESISRAMNSRLEHNRPNPGKRRLKGLLLQKDNRFCADCGSRDPKWASVNIGVFICLKCCGAHRSLGTHISKVLSVTLDEWCDEDIDAMAEVGGNAAANSIYEAYIPDEYSKPGPDGSHDDRMKFIRSKYELQEFLKPSLRILSMTPANSSLQPSSSLQQSGSIQPSSSRPPSSSLQPSFSDKLMNSFRITKSTKKSDNSQEGMVEFIGVLKVKVIKGTNLAVRDMLTSDPYVVLNLGKQTVQTSVMKSNLNPVWNEELMLSVPQSYGPVKLKVYDKDTFSADDIMGEAEIDIQSLITSAMAFGDAGMFGDMQIGKWLKSNDNALIEDSIINIVDGTVKQHMQLKLQNVESGELEVELEWMPLDQ